VDDVTLTSLTTTTRSK